MAEMKIADPLVDTAFKHLLSLDDSKDIAISILNAFIPDFKKCPAVDIRPCPTTEPVLVENSKEQKQTFLDYHVKDQDGNSVLVELQKGRHINFDERALFYAAYGFAIFQGGDALKREKSEFRLSGHWYKNLKKVYALQIVDYDSNAITGIADDICDDRLYREVQKHPMKDDQYFKHYFFTDALSGQKLEAMQLIQIELPRADRIKDLFPARKEFTTSEWWLSIFKHHERYTEEYIEELKMRNTIPNEVISGLKRLDVSFWNPELLREYKEDISSESYSDQHKMWKLEGIQEERERAEKMLAEERKRTEKAKKEAEKAKKEAEHKIKLEAEKTRNEVEKAKKEAESSKKMMAKIMLSSGISIEEVAKVSGFSIDELRKIN